MRYLATLLFLVQANFLATAAPLTPAQLEGLRLPDVKIESAVHRGAEEGNQNHRHPIGK